MHLAFFPVVASRVARRSDNTVRVRPRMPFVEKPRNYPPANLNGSCVLQVWSLPLSLLLSIRLTTAPVLLIFKSLSSRSSLLRYALLRSARVRSLAAIFVSFKAVDVLIGRLAFTLNRDLYACWARTRFSRGILICNGSDCVTNVISFHRNFLFNPYC